MNINWEVVGISSITVGIIFAAMAIIYYLSTAKNIKKQHKRYEEVLTDLKVGDEVVFAGGIVGVVQSIDSDRLFTTIKVSNNTVVKAAIYSISSIIKQK